jgi:alpha-L-rhamnosidase
MARALGKAQDASRFDALAEKIRAAYYEKFIDGKGKVGTGSQANQAIGLHTGIIPPELREDALTNLMQDVESHGGHLTTGILGTKFMLDELSRAGHADLAYAIVSKRGFPGWAWMLENGATTLWEHWELSEDTFSHNHPMFGSVSEWMMKWLGGIQPADDAIGFDRIIIRPQTVPGIDWVKSTYRSVRGKIVSNWARSGGITIFEIEIPPNTTAIVYLPREISGMGVSPMFRNGHATLGSGRHFFRMP